MKAPAATDKECEDAWKRIMKIAEHHQLIVQAFSGTATLALPSEQRKVRGLREKVLNMHMVNEFDGRKVPCSPYLLYDVPEAKEE